MAIAVNCSLKLLETGSLELFGTPKSIFWSTGVELYCFNSLFELPQVLYYHPTAA
jgi:hypothetical protein